MNATLRDQRRPSSQENVAVVADDILEGAEAIARFLGVTPRRAKYLIEKRMIPYGKLGGRCLASKRRLIQHLQVIVAGETAR